MNNAIEQMLKKYHCHTEQDYINALKEILQEIALLGLWRAKFFEHAAFYGGSSLRILYGLDRFSEDLDFTLLKPNKRFSLASYNRAIETELQSFGLEAEIITKIKNVETNIESAFIKAGTKKQLIVIEAPAEIYKRIHRMHLIKIKVEIDSNPPGKFATETKTLLQPIPFNVRTLVKSDLFAGKIHAILCRPWQQRVKGRDWYDFVWYIAQGIPVNLIHLQERLIQSQAWKEARTLEKNDLMRLLKDKINCTNFAEAKKDVLPFLRDFQSIDLWSTEFFSKFTTAFAKRHVNSRALKLPPAALKLLLSYQKVCSVHDIFSTPPVRPSLRAQDARGNPVKMFKFCWIASACKQRKPRNDGENEGIFKNCRVLRKV